MSLPGEDPEPTGGRLLSCPAGSEFVTPGDLKVRAPAAQSSGDAPSLTRNLSGISGRAPAPHPGVPGGLSREGLISLEQHAGCFRIALQKVEERWIWSSPPFYNGSDS